MDGANIKVVAPFNQARGAAVLPLAWLMEERMARSEGARPNGDGQRSARCIALVGPYLSGKTTLLEAILARTGKVTRQGRVSDASTVGDNSPEARAHGMSIEINVADTEYLGDKFTFIDCPGSIEFQHDASEVLAVADAVVVVCEPDEKRVPALQLLLKQLEQSGTPHYLFLNKIDTFNIAVRDILKVLQPASVKPLVLRQIPIWKDGIATGFVDLALKRAFVYREHAPSEVIELSGDDAERQKEARFTMLEQIADYDDELMEQLLEDIEPPRDQIFGDLARELKEGLICPVLLGSAENGNGIVRLLKALRHEVPFVSGTSARAGVPSSGNVAHVVKTVYTAHGGKLSIARVMSGKITDGQTMTSPHGQSRIAGMFTMLGQDAKKVDSAVAGETVALGRLDEIRTGDLLSGDGEVLKRDGGAAAPEPVYGVAVTLKDRKDEVKLSSALSKLMEEDPALTVEHNRDTHQMVLKGQGEMHLRVALERLARKYGVEVGRARCLVPYKETIRKVATVRGRHKKQSGGHGQFGDVVIELRPLPRGAGFNFAESIVGGAVPKQFIPSVEIGVKDYMQHGPLGFPVVDVGVTLKDGSFHTVDSSDMAFRQAARLAMSEGMPQCSPVILEPVMAVEVAVPTDATAKITGIISQRRGQVLGFNPRDGWPGWDVVQAHIPEAEMNDLIVDLRSVTQGVGTFRANFDHLAELTGRLAEQAIAAHKEAAE